MTIAGRCTHAPRLLCTSDCEALVLGTWTHPVVWVVADAEFDEVVIDTGLPRPVDLALHSVKCVRAGLGNK